MPYPGNPKEKLNSEFDMENESNYELFFMFVISF
jgi:hypothetical protein